MSYISESLGANETLKYQARFHWLHKVGAWLTLLMFLGFAAAALAGLSWPIALLLAAIGFAFFVAMMMPIWTTEIGVTSQRFIKKRGMVWRKTDELQLRAIEEVNLEQGFFGRMLGYGRIILHGTGVNDIRLPNLADPVGLRKALQEAMGALAPPANPAPAQAAPVA